MLKDFNKIKEWAIEQVLWAERNMSGKTGAEKCEIVIKRLDDLITLPFYLEWLDDKIIEWLVDLVCEKLNWAYDYDFSQAELDSKQIETLANELEDDGITEFCEDEPKHDDSNFERSIEFSLKWEGGRNFEIVNGKPVIKGAVKNDLGGATAYGIIISTLKAAYAAGVVSHDDICKLTQDEAKEIYCKNFWDRYGWGELDFPACLCCLDCSINHGGFAWILQRAAVDCGQNIKIDGKFGKQTFNALKACEPVALAKAIVNQRRVYYEKIVAKNPSQKVFLTGWTRRVNDMAEAEGIK